MSEGPTANLGRTATRVGADCRRYPPLVSGSAPQSIFWIGGGSGAGKTSIARALVARLDLRVYHIDAYGYDHVSRMADGPFPRTQEFNTRTYDERWLRLPAALADDFLAISRERLPLIMDDLATLGPGPTVVVEGPQLLPALLAPILNGPEHALWLLPTFEFGRRGVTQRGEVVPSSEEAAASINRYERDVLVTELLRQQAVDLGLRTIEVDGSRTLNETVQVVMEALRELPNGLRCAEDGRQREQIRRRENEVVAHQLAAYWRDMGRDVMPDAPEGPFSCECLQLGCDREAMLSVTDYTRRAAVGAVVQHDP